jgi:hypothetical protein
MYSTRRYAIKNKTGLWFDGNAYTDRGLTTAGKPRKTGPGIRKSCFKAGKPILFSKDYFDFHIRQAIREARTDLFEDTEIVAFDYKMCKTTLRMGTVRAREEAKEIIRKLKV